MKFIVAQNKILSLKYLVYAQFILGQTKNSLSHLVSKWRVSIHYLDILNPSIFLQPIQRYCYSHDMVFIVTTHVYHKLISVYLYHNTYSQLSAAPQTSSMSLGLVSSIFWNVHIPAFTRAFAKVGPENKCTIIHAVYICI